MTKLKTFEEAKNITKGDLAKQTYPGQTYDITLPQDWLDRFCAISGKEYDLVKFGLVWGYKTGSVMGAPWPIVKELEEWLKEYNSRGNKRSYPNQVAKLVVEQLIEDQVDFMILFSAPRSADDPAGGVIQILEQDWDLFFTRAENAAKYWLFEAPNRHAPYNSTDAYNPKKYPKVSK